MLLVHNWTHHLIGLSDGNLSQRNRHSSHTTSYFSQRLPNAFGRVVGDQEAGVSVNLAAILLVNLQKPRLYVIHITWDHAAEIRGK